MHKYKLQETAIFKNINIHMTANVNLHENIIFKNNASLHRMGIAGIMIE
jgi:hypothetical protein